MGIRRTTISMPETLYQLATKQMEDLLFPTFSDYVQHLIRQAVLKKSPAPADPAQPKDFPH